VSELEFYAFAGRVVFGTAAAGAAILLVGWIALLIQNERRMRALRKQGHIVLPVFPFGYVMLPPPPELRNPWEAR
jgi:hypothetical protein